MSCYRGKLLLRLLLRKWKRISNGLIEFVGNVMLRFIWLMEGLNVTNADAFIPGRHAGDLAIRRLTSKTFFDIDLDVAEGDDPNKFPGVLSDLKSKHFYVTLNISAENINNEYDGYEASDIALENENLFLTNTLQESAEAEDDSNSATGHPPRVVNDEIQKLANQSNLFDGECRLAIPPISQE
ncbi:hypothetical protein POM88_022999 [Heracleum sosnowskyi]|uniref:Uncharacterized protein n=1 Tax=Heracleum sosnowskyi TaxID=360622 RepID=A0AAD8MU73_9APIA|nr:hypothetical protein POM88_022999 [Heracleum sosnowskyi]